MAKFTPVDTKSVTKKPITFTPVNTSGAGSASENKIIDEVLRNEGGFQNDPNDRGNYFNGALIGTNRGITPATLSQWRGGASITQADMKSLTEDEARQIYRHEYIIKPGFDKLPEGIRANVIDMGVNAGPRRAAKLLQSITGAGVDGVIGPETISKAALANNAAYSDARISYYQSIATGGNAKFLRGWTNRANRFR